jgi:excinuclease ABC subunit C
VKRPGASLKSFGKYGFVSLGEYANIPKFSGVYIFRDNSNEPLYVGKAKNLKSRITSYSKGAIDPRISSMLSKARAVEYIVTNNEAEALILECNLIKYLKPRYNISLRDDKRYPYLCITREDFPRIFLTRRVNPLVGEYLGPYINADALRKTIILLQGVFKIRVCRQKIKEGGKNGKICLYYNIGRCEAPCVGSVSSEEYKSKVFQAREVLKGRGRGYLSQLRREYAKAIKGLMFERASIIKGDISALEMLISEQRIETMGGDEDVVATVCENDLGACVIFKVRQGKLVEREVFVISSEGNIIEGEAIASLIKQRYSQAPVYPKRIAVNVLPDELSSLEKILKSATGKNVNIWSPKKGRIKRLIDMAVDNAGLILKEEVIRKKQKSFVEAHIELMKLLSIDMSHYSIDGIDISVLSKSGRVGSSVRSELGRPVKKYYRRYLIRGDATDDIGMMREVVSRKIARGEMAEILLLDGGRGQLSGVADLFRDTEKGPGIIAIAKGTPDKFYILKKGRPVRLKVSDNLKMLLTRVRDEAHRFAHSYQLKTRQFDISFLDNIRGIGKTRKREILKLIYEVGIERISEEQFKSIRGLSREKIIEVINNLKSSE